MKLPRITPTTRTKATTAAAGFTLVESAVALAIGGIMLTSLYGCFASGFATVKTSRENTRATQILLTKMEAIRLCSYDQLTNAVYNPRTFAESFSPTGDANSSGGVVYSGTFATSVPDVGTLPDSYRTNMTLVTVTLNWTSGQMQHTRTMQTYAARDGMAGFVSVGQ
jgi:prepilin-type N-terminal cleavage/methylation domain-containing protein